MGLAILGLLGPLGLLGLQRSCCSDGPDSLAHGQELLDLQVVWVAADGAGPGQGRPHPSSMLISQYRKCDLSLS